MLPMVAGYPPQHTSALGLSKVDRRHAGFLLARPFLRQLGQTRCRRETGIAGHLRLHEVGYGPDQEGAGLSGPLPVQPRYESSAQQR
jgi:hypothetical protein